jgi:serine/threonine protein kinase
MIIDSLLNFNLSLLDFTIIGKITNNIYKVYDKNNNLRVIKELDINEHSQHEIYHHKLLNGNNYIITLYDCFRENGKYYMIMECMEYDLFGYLHNTDITEEIKLEIFYRCLKAIEYCHSRNILHLDIKLENFLVNPENKHVKIIDFGLSQSPINQSRKKSGTVEYMAPEIFLDLKPTKLTDVWALGVLFCEIFSVPSTSPFQDISVFRTRENILRLDYEISDIPKNYQSLPREIFVLEGRKTLDQLLDWCIREMVKLEIRF